MIDEKIVHSDCKNHCNRLLLTIPIRFAATAFCNHYRSVNIQYLLYREPSIKKLHPHTYQTNPDENEENTGL